MKMADSKDSVDAVDEETDTAGETEEIIAKCNTETKTNSTEDLTSCEEKGSQKKITDEISEETLVEKEELSVPSSPQAETQDDEDIKKDRQESDLNSTPKTPMSVPITPTSTPNTPMSAPITPCSTPGSGTKTTPMKKLPIRCGINWVKGEKLEAMDYLEKWYAAKISDLDADEKMILVHFEGWNVRYDEWVPMDSDRIRPIQRHSDRQKKKHFNDFKAGEKILAKWTDCKMYPAKIDSINRDGSYNVRFYDGFRKTLTSSSIRPVQDPKEDKKPELKKSEGKESKSPLETPKSSKLKVDQKSVEVKRKDSHGNKIKGKLIVAGSFHVKRDQSNSATKKHKEKEKIFKGINEKTSEKKSPSVTNSDKPTLTPSKSTEKTTPKPSPSSATKKVKLSALKTPPIVGAKRTQKKSFSTSGITTVDESPSPVIAKRTKSLDKPPVTAPKEFIIEEDHNMFKCVHDNCGKSFRKEGLLESHIKYYHTDHQPKTPTIAAPRKRRKTSSICSSDSEQSSSIRNKSTTGSVTPQETPPNKRRRHVSTDLHVAMETSLPQTPEVIDAGSTKEETLHEGRCLPGMPQSDTVSSNGNIAGSSQDNIPSAIVDEEEEEDDDVAHCKCGYDYEEDLMIQCDVCLSWQHAVCFNITEATLPKKHICHVCENPPGVRDSARYIHEQDWFKHGQLPAYSFLPGRVSSIRTEEMQETQDIAGEIHQLSSTLHALKIQLKLIRQKNHPAVALWKTNWDNPEESSSPNTTAQVDEYISVDESSPVEVQPEIPAEPKPEEETLPADTSCPREETADPPTLSQLSVVKDMMDKVTEDSSTESVVSGQSPMLEEEDSQKSVELSANILSDSTEEVGVRRKESAAEEIQRQCERNMLVHILRVQAEINQKLDIMDEKLSGLEVKKGIMGNEDLPPSAPRLKRGLHNLSRDLEKVKLMAAYQGAKHH